MYSFDIVFRLLLLLGFFSLPSFCPFIPIKWCWCRFFLVLFGFIALCCFNRIFLSFHHFLRVFWRFLILQSFIAVAIHIDIVVGRRYCYCCRRCCYWLFVSFSCNFVFNEPNIHIILLFIDFDQFTYINCILLLFIHFLFCFIYVTLLLVNNRISYTLCIDYAAENKY